NALAHRNMRNKLAVNRLAGLVVLARRRASMAVCFAMTPTSAWRGRLDALRRGALAVSLGMIALAGPTAGHALGKVKAVLPQNSVFILNWQGARDAGVFTKHGIDLEVDARPFAGYLAGLPSKECDASTYSGIDAILKMNQGMNLAVIGGGLTVFQEIYVRKD